MTELAIVAAFAALQNTRRTAGQRYNQALYLAFADRYVAIGM